MEILKFNELPPLAQKLLPLLLSNQKENLQIARMHFLSYLREKHNNPDFLADIALPKIAAPIKKARYKGLEFYANPNRKYSKAWRRFELEARAFLDSFMPKTPFCYLDLLHKDWGDGNLYRTFKYLSFVNYSFAGIFIDGVDFNEQIKENWREFIIDLLNKLATYPIANKSFEFQIRMYKEQPHQIEKLPQGYLNFFANEFEPFAKKLFPECTFYYC